MCKSKKSPVAGDIEPLISCFLGMTLMAMTFKVHRFYVHIYVQPVSHSLRLVRPNMTLTSSLYTTCAVVGKTEAVKCLMFENIHNCVVSFYIVAVAVRLYICRCPWVLESKFFDVIGNISILGGKTTLEV